MNSKWLDYISTREERALAYRMAIHAAIAVHEEAPCCLDRVAVPTVLDVVYNAVLGHLIERRLALTEQGCQHE